MHYLRIYIKNILIVLSCLLIISCGSYGSVDLLITRMDSMIGETESDLIRFFRKQSDSSYTTKDGVRF